MVQEPVQLVQLLLCLLGPFLNWINVYCINRCQQFSRIINFACAIELFVDKKTSYKGNDILMNFETIIVYANLKNIVF